MNAWYVWYSNRFTQENKAKRPMYSYLPFGLGPRVCVGMRLVVMETKMALIAMIQNFKFFSCSKTEVRTKQISSFFFIYLHRQYTWQNEIYKLVICETYVTRKECVIHEEWSIRILETHASTSLYKLQTHSTLEKNYFLDKGIWVIFPVPLTWIYMFS